MTPLFDDRFSLRDRAIFALYSGGLNSSEIAAVRACDLFVNRSRDSFSIRITPETAPDKSVRLTTLYLLGAERRAVERYLESIVKDRLRPSSWLFPGRRDGHAIEPRTVRMILQSMVEAAEGVA